MGFISTKIHAILDFVIAVTLIAFPWILGFGGPAQLVLVTVGILMAVISLLSIHEIGIYKIVPMEIHLLVDAFLGLFMMMSPWLIGFAHVEIGPHILIGLLVIVVTIFSKTRPAGYPRHQSARTRS
jgi:phosphatidylserine synthase